MTGSLAHARVAVVVGNPKPRSRTLEAALLLVDALGAPVPATVLDLGEHAADVVDPGSARAAAWVEEVRSADLVVAASPTYKAAYTGLLKCFLDRLPHRGLDGRAAVALMLGAGPRHALAAELTLVPLLRELGAVVPAPALYVEDHDHTDPVPYRAWADASSVSLRAALSARPATTGALA